MASYQPSVELRVARPCGESWEAMEGGSRTRHCGSCERDVVNVAALTPVALEELLAKPGPVPCMRIVRMEDGGVLTARVEPRQTLLTRIAAAVSTAVLASAAAAQTPASAKQATLEGRVVDPSGVPVAGARVALSKDGRSLVVQTGDHGEFAIRGPAGAYEVSATAKGFQNRDAGHVQLISGARELTAPIRLEVGLLEMGETVSVPLKTRKGKKVDVAPAASVSTDKWDQKSPDIGSEHPALQRHDGVASVQAGAAAGGRVLTVTLGAPMPVAAAADAEKPKAAVAPVNVPAK